MTTNLKRPLILSCCLLAWLSVDTGEASAQLLFGPSPVPKTSSKSTGAAVPSSQVDRPRYHLEASAAFISLGDSQEAFSALGGRLMIGKGNAAFIITTLVGEEWNPDPRDEKPGHLVSVNLGTAIYLQQRGPIRPYLTGQLGVIVVGGIIGDLRGGGGIRVDLARHLFVNAEVMAGVPLDYLGANVSVGVAI